MSVQPSKLVVDASVGIKLFVNERLSDAAHSLFAQLGQSEVRFYTPDLFYVECTNVLWKYVRRGGMPATDAAAAVEQLGRLALISVPTATLTSAAFTIANTYDVTAYDAVYAALATQVDAPLVTADEALVHKLRGADLKVRWFG